MPAILSLAVIGKPMCTVHRNAVRTLESCLQGGESMRVCVHRSRACKCCSMASMGRPQKACVRVHANTPPACMPAALSLVTGKPMAHTHTHSHTTRPHRNRHPPPSQESALSHVRRVGRWVSIVFVRGRPHFTREGIIYPLRGHRKLCFEGDIRSVGKMSVVYPYQGNVPWA